MIRPRATRLAAFFWPGTRKEAAMIIVLKAGASDSEIEDIRRRILAMGYKPHMIRGELRTVVGAVGDDRGKERLRALESLECVESGTPVLQPFKPASRQVNRE